MKRNNNIPKGDKNSPLGIIPQEWEVKRFSDLFSFKNGINSDKESYGKGIKFVNTMDVLNSQYLTYDAIRGSLVVSNEKMKDFSVQYGDILFNRTSETPNDIGHSTVYLDTSSVVFGGFIIRAKCTNSCIDDKFKIYCFKSDIVRKQIISFGNGAIRYNIGQEDLSKTQIALPPLPEQQKIAEILTYWDTAIEKQTQLIEKLEARKRGLMQQLLTGKKRLNGFEGKWKKKGAGEIFKSISIKGFTSEDLLSATQDKGMIPRRLLEGRVTMPASGTEGFKLVEKGNFVISLRSFQGGLEYSYYRGLVSPAYTVLKSKIAINDEFYRQYFKSYDFIGHLAIAVVGIRDGKQISYDDFCTVKIPCIAIEEQTAIAHVLLAADDEIRKEKETLEALNKQKKGLMQQLLTGKRRVKANG